MDGVVFGLWRRVGVDIARTLVEEGFGGVYDWAKKKKRFCGCWHGDADGGSMLELVSRRRMVLMRTFYDGGRCDVWKSDKMCLEDEEEETEAEFRKVKGEWSKVRKKLSGYFVLLSEVDDE